MLQPSLFKPQQAPLSLFAVESTDLLTAPSPARMSVSRLCLDANTIPSSGLPPQDVDHIRNYFAAAEFVRHQSGMNVNTGAHSKRSYIEKSSGGDSAGDVEWEGAPRDSKRREIRVERESRSDRYTEADQHHYRPSGGSDLTTEQSVAPCMAADDHSTTTRSTSSLNEDGCLLKLHSAVPPISGYGDVSPDVDEDDHSSKLVCSDAAAACASYNVHASFSHFPTPPFGEHWLAAASHHACARYDHHTQHDPHNVNKQQGEEVEADWLKLSLGRNTVRDDVMHMSRSSSPCTLQLLPEEPDCAVMKEREKHMKELRHMKGLKPDCAVMKEREKHMKECHYERMTTTAATFEQADQQLESSLTAGRSPLISGQHHVDQLGNMRENDPHFYTNLMQTNFLPLPPADCTIGQYITSRGLLPIHYNVDRSSNPTISALDHQSAVHMQQLLQGDSLSQSRAASLHALQGQSSFRSMVCTSLREGPVGSCPVSTRSPLPDFSQQNSWDLLESSSSQSPCSMLPPPATSFRDLIAGSIVQEPLDKLDYGSVSLLPAIPKQRIYNGDQLNHHMMWPRGKMQHNQSSNFVNYSNDVAMAIERVNTSTGFGNKSMSDWLSQALSATKFDPINLRSLPEDGDPDHDCTKLSTGRQKVIHGRQSKHQPPMKLIAGGHSAAARGSPGFWFGLQPSNRQPEGSGSEGEAEENMQFKTSYVRLKDGNVPLSVVKKFLITKLGLSQESQVAFACRGKILEESSYLKRVQDDIWLPFDFVQIETLNFKSGDSYNIPKDNVMILTYQILK